MVYIVAPGDLAWILHSGPYSLCAAYRMMTCVSVSDVGDAVVHLATVVMRMLFDPRLVAVPSVVSDVIAIDSHHVV